MQPWVFDLIRVDFNKISNKRIIANALDRKRALQCYFQGVFLDVPAIVRYPDQPDKKDVSFNNIDFRNKPFVDAIEDFIISTSRDILEIAPKRGITTVVNQIFGKGALEVIEMGAMPIEEPVTKAVPPAPKPDGFYGENVLSFQQLAARRNRHHHV